MSLWQTNDPAILTRRMLRLVVAAIIAASLYIIVKAVISYQGTGVVSIISPNSNALIGVGQTDHRTVILGTGKASARLKPGVYQISATGSGKQTIKQVRVVKKHSVTVYLKPVQQFRIRSASDINFKGTNALLDNGLSSAQLSDLEHYIFRFNPKAETVSIDQDSVVPGRRQAGTDEPFVLNFSLVIDSVPYKASTNHTNPNTINLSLYSNDGQPVFNSTSSLPGG